MKYDVFISHASEDKADFVRPLVHALAALGLRVWYDEDMIRAGDSIGQSIDSGLRDARNAVVVLSPTFLKKQWTKWELHAFVHRVNQVRPRRRGRLIPIWHQVSLEDVRKFSPPLADLAALVSSEGIEQIAVKIRDLTMPRSQVPRKPASVGVVDARVVESIVTAFLRFLRSALKTEHVDIRVYLPEEGDGECLLRMYPKSGDEMPSYKVPTSPRRGLTEWKWNSTPKPFAERRELPRAIIATPIVVGPRTKPAGVLHICSYENIIFKRETAFLMDTFVPMATSVFQALLLTGMPNRGR